MGIKWIRNVTTALFCGGAAVAFHPERWRLGLLLVGGWFVFGCLLDLAIARFLPRRKVRRVNLMKCNICQHSDRAICFYSVWYPDCGGPEPAVNPQLKCPKCGSNDLEEVDG